MTSKYLLVPDAKAILLPLSYGSFLPEAVKVEVEGKAYAAVKHTLMTTRLLRANGVMVPSPIGYQYGWPKVGGLYPPWHHQRETAAFLTLYPRCYCLNEMSTGKTHAALWAADYLMQIGEIKRALIIAPLSTLHLVWGSALYDTFQHRKFTILRGARKRRQRLFDQEHDFYIINHDGFDIIARQLDARLDVSLLIPDELAAYRNSGTSRYDYMQKHIGADHYVWGMTGAPTPQAPTDAWAQCQLVTPHTVDPTFSSFRHKTMEQQSSYIWTPRRNAMDIVYGAMRPAIRYTKAQCHDIPETLHSYREVEMTPAQKKIVKELSTDLITEYNNKVITAANAGVKLFKIIQAACGVVYGNDGEEIVVGAEPRINVVRELVEQSESKTIIFVPFRSALNMVAEALKKDFSVGIVHGDVPAGPQRDRIFRDFQHRQDPHVLVADAQCMSHGLTLTAASTTIWYAPEASNDIYMQANERTPRPGQKLKTNIIHLQGTTLERMLYKRNISRGTLQKVFLDMVQAGTLS